MAPVATISCPCTCAGVTAVRAAAKPIAVRVVARATTTRRASRKVQTSTPIKTDNWCRLRPIWQGKPEDALALRPGDLPAEMPALAPAARLLILSNGSPTKHLEYLSGVATAVDCLQAGDLISAPSPLDCAPPLPAGVEEVGSSLIQRQVIMKAGCDGEPLMYAASWWSPEAMEAHMTDPSKPIWANLASQKLEVYRDLQQLYYGSNPQLEALLGRQGPFWGRHYTFVHGGRAMCCIYEVFSPRLYEVMMQQ